ncbi:MAG: LCP family protein [Clostridiales bacterium]|nr:LCP family protein [Clostridiales bacterium]
MSKKKKKKRNALDILIVVLTIVLVMMFSVICWAMYITRDVDTEPVSANAATVSSSEDTSEEPEQTESEFSALPSENKRNIAAFGVDKDGVRTDVAFVVSMDRKEKTIAMLNIPRDTRVVMTDQMIREIEQRGGNVPVRDGVTGMCKFNEVHAYAGKDHRNEYSVKMLEDLLGIHIDNYIKVNTEAFREIVDAVGGVDIDVPMDMHYEDPYQDLYIHLEAGPQHLDGAKAEQLVRFRKGYANQDLGRIETQQVFMKALLQKIMSTENLLKGLPSIIKTVFQYVDTDLSIGDCLNLVSFLNDFEMENMSTETLPGTGGSYFDIDEEATEEIVHRIFYTSDPLNRSAAESGKEEAMAPATMIGYPIEVSNGSGKENLAGEYADLLEEKGYVVEEITTFSGPKQEATRIICDEDGSGESLKEIFPDAEVITDPKMIMNGTRIKIILGTAEKGTGE